ncbi:hypothetical protein PILCRDRAFT_2942 [Piloderma croceum F 1598]|uniref:Uncharacterized protein n=1 Tax=Piloderma croceum (strain F 1598) TaxID=765440 RepID=A0A0C3GAI3_PILCF|nr:hypothetical protein PILCRDRAFT_2942 [Piloderma croceum F 1598]
MTPTNGTYDITPFDYRLEFKAEVVDITGTEFIADALAHEVAAYTALDILQGSIILKYVTRWRPDTTEHPNWDDERPQMTTLRWLSAR